MHRTVHTIQSSTNIARVNSLKIFLIIPHTTSGVQLAHSTFTFFFSSQFGVSVYLIRVCVRIHVCACEDLKRNIQ